MTQELLLQNHPLVHRAYTWTHAEHRPFAPKEQACETRDAFDVRMERLRRTVVARGMKEDASYLLHAILSEIGGNSFDHNLGQWRDVPGVLFAWEEEESSCIVTLADRGQGVRATLRRILPAIQSDEEALRVAFTQRISGRAPERRGNGLKFVREILLQDGTDLLFHSGGAQYRIIGKREVWQESETSVPGCLAAVSFPLR